MRERVPVEHGSAIGDGIRRERQRDGIEAARERGVYKGRPKEIDADQVRALKAEGLGAAEIAKRVGGLIENFGPNSIATYLGGGVVDQPAATTFMRSFTKAIGSPNFYTAATIDQPGGAIADALHGRWMGGRQRPAMWDAFLIVGGNQIGRAHV